MKMRNWLTIVAFLAMTGGAWAETSPDSKRMERAKDFFAEEQWARAIAEFQAVAANPRETNRDEALFWLAQSEHETGDHSAAIQTIARLERLFPKSPWVRFARSLRVEIAQRLNRADVLWAFVTPPAAPAPAPRPGATPMALPPVPPAAPPPPRTPGSPRPTMMAMPPAAAPMPAPAPMAGVAPPAPPAAPAPAAPPRPVVRPGFLVPPSGATPTLIPGAEFFLPTPHPSDIDLRIEALNGLLEGHSEKVIPLLREIALDGNNPDEGRRAIIVLAQVAPPRGADDGHRRGPARRRAGPHRGDQGNGTVRRRHRERRVDEGLFHLHDAARQAADRVVARRAGRQPLPAADRERRVRCGRARDTAIELTLGRLPDARPQLRTLYRIVRPESRMAVLSALFSSKDEDELIRIARTEKDADAPRGRPHAAPACWGRRKRRSSSWKRSLEQFAGSRLAVCSLVRSPESAVRCRPAGTTATLTANQTANSNPTVEPTTAMHC